MYSQLLWNLKFITMSEKVFNWMMPERDKFM